MTKTGDTNLQTMNTYDENQCIEVCSRGVLAPPKGRGVGFDIRNQHMDKHRKKSTELVTWPNSRLQEHNNKA
jgi:hypothetical protein